MGKIRHARPPATTADAGAVTVFAGTAAPKHGLRGRTIIFQLDWLWIHVNHANPAALAVGGQCATSTVHEQVRDAARDQLGRTCRTGEPRASVLGTNPAPAS